MLNQNIQCCSTTVASFFFSRINVPGTGTCFWLCLQISTLGPLNFKMSNRPGRAGFGLVRIGPRFGQMIRILHTFYNFLFNFLKFNSYINVLVTIDWSTSDFGRSGIHLIMASTGLPHPLIFIIFIILTLTTSKKASG